MNSPQKHDLFGRIMGVIVFALGVGIILYVLRLAFLMLQDPSLGLTSASNAKTGMNFALVGIDFGKLLIRILLLSLCALCGSLVANKGVNLYFLSFQPREKQP
jgi:hypothetical protein